MTNRTDIAALVASLRAIEVPAGFSTYDMVVEIDEPVWAPTYSETEQAAITTASLVIIDALGYTPWPGDENLAAVLAVITPATDGGSHV